MYGLKPIPFTSGAKAHLLLGADMYGLKPIPFTSGAKAHDLLSANLYGLKPVPFIPSLMNPGLSVSSA
jgi:hypothetical protein